MLLWCSFIFVDIVFFVRLEVIVRWLLWLVVYFFIFFILVFVNLLVVFIGYFKLILIFIYLFRICKWLFI